MTRRRAWTLLAALLTARLALNLALYLRLGGATFLVSPTEAARTAYALDWAAAPSVSPENSVHWLPLQFYVEGLALRAWRAPFEVPFALNTAATLAGLALVFLLTLELFGSETAALAAAAAAWLDPPGVLLGIGGAFDAPERALALLGLWLWARAERTGTSLRPAACAFALGNAARYEAWLLAAAFSSYVLLRRPRERAALAAVWAFPLFWLAFNARALGDPLFFARGTFAAEIRGAASPVERLAGFSTELARTAGAATLALAAIKLARARGAASWYGASLGWLTLALALLSTRGMVEVDLHLDLIAWLALPAAAAAAVEAVVALPRPSRGACAAALAAGFVLMQAQEISGEIERRSASPRAALARLCRAASESRRAEAWPARDSILVELPEGPGRRVADNRIWRLCEAPVAFDRRLEVRTGPAGGAELATESNPSLLDGPGVCRALKQASARWVVARGRGEALAACGYAREASDGGLTLWRRP